MKFGPRKLTFVADRFFASTLDQIDGVERAPEPSLSCRFAQKIQGCGLRRIRLPATSSSAPCVPSAWGISVAQIGRAGHCRSTCDDGRQQPRLSGPRRDRI